MNHQFPVYTVEAECQDCYKCVRTCPVKAIRVQDGHAEVMPELCLACGKCVAVCPSNAKKIRDDRGRLCRLLAAPAPVYASLAPSWVCEFPGVRPEQMVAALRRLGFAGAGETALGAQEVSAAVAHELRKGLPGLHLSSACPAAVSFVRKYLPEHLTTVTRLHSPLLAHSRLLREAFGGDISVVFIGPCIAKKNEADAHPDLLNLAMTFRDLHAWLEEAGLHPETLTGADADHFVPERAEEGAFYPVEGGMNATIRAYGGVDHAGFFCLAGIAEIRSGLEHLETAALTRPVFVECLACEGGCINGPCVKHGSALIERHLRIEAATQWPGTARTPRLDIAESYTAEPVSSLDCAPEALREALARFGKSDKADELNCGGCGYNTCRHLAAALLAGNAEPTMCVSYMRKQAQKKANALLRCMPSGVVIADENLRIIECNERFARLIGEENAQLYQVRPGLKGCVLEKIVPFADLFRKVLRTDKELRYDHLRVRDRLFNVTIFSLEPHQVVGAVILDVTRRELHRDQIAQKANEVITRNLSTVQEIACRLGEHMAETEILLRSIAEDYGTEDHTSTLHTLDAAFEETGDD